MHNPQDLGDRVVARANAGAALTAPARFSVTWSVECVAPNGALKWADLIESNLVVDVGLNDILDKYFKGATYTAAHFVGLTSGTPTIAAGDTMSSHAGWTDQVPYSNATRPSFTPGTVASKSVDNSASKAVFNCNATGTVGGAFLTTNSTKSGTTGTLVSAGAFTGGNKTVANGDTLNVQVTYTASST
jgi:hypothetical protein